MKKLILLTLSTLLFFQCNEESDVMEELVADESAFVNVVAQGTSLLKSDPAFMNYFGQVLNQLRSQVPAVDVSTIVAVNGEVSFATDTDFHNTYGQFEQADESWMQSYDQAIALLLSDVNSNYTLRKQFSNEDEIVNDIEDLLEDEQVTDSSLKDYIAAKMPVATLYQKISELESQWLDSSGETLDFSADPTNDYVDDEILTLLLNHSSTANIAGNSVDFQANASLRRSEKSDKPNRIEMGCVEHRRVVQVQSQNKKRLKVSLAVRDYGLYQYVSGKATGYAKTRRGKWRKRRFHKDLTIAGNMWDNSDNQNTRCNPDNMFFYTQSTSGSRKKIRIKITRTNYRELSLQDDGFSATGSAGSLTNSVTI